MPLNQESSTPYAWTYIVRAFHTLTDSSSVLAFAKEYIDGVGRDPRPKWPLHECAGTQGANLHWPQVLQGELHSGQAVAAPAR